MTIGEAIAKLRPDFPDVTVSKIRFLETEGLVEPSRTGTGYRKFTYADVERLRYILSAQRDQYLPLRVIKERLDALDRGERPPAPQGGSPRAPRVLVPAADPQDSAYFQQDEADVRRSRADLLDASGLTDDQLRELEAYGLVTVRPGREPYDADALRVAKLVAQFASFGLQPRHLRAAKTAADRQAGLVEQVVAPTQHQQDPDARQRADETAEEIAALCVNLHAALMRTELRESLGL